MEVALNNNQQQADDPRPWISRPWEKEQNKAASSASADDPRPWISKPWEKNAQVDNYLPNTEALRKGFSGDPLAAFDPQERSAMEKVLNVYPKPDEEAKKHVMSQYLAPRVGMPPESVYNNFQVVADTYFKQKNIGVNEAYNNIAKIFNPDSKGGSGAVFRWSTPEDLNKAPSGILGAGAKLVAGITNPANDKTVPGQIVNHITSGAANLAIGAMAYPNILARQTTDVANGLLWNLPVTLAGKPEWQIWYDESVMGTRNNPLKTTYDAAGMLQAAVEKNLQSENVQGDLVDNFKAGNYANMGKIIAYGIAENAPQFAIPALTNNPAFLSAKLQGLTRAEQLEKMSNFGLMLMGASQAGSQRMQYDAQPGDSATKDFAATMTGLFEVQTEKLFELPILQKFFAGNPAAKKSAIKSTVEALVDYAKAGTGEAVSQFGQNVTDRATGLGDQPLHAQLLENFVIGALLDGSPAAVNLYRAVTSAPKMSYFDYDHLQAEVKNNVIAPAKAEILAKPNPTDEEVATLRRLDNMGAADIIGNALVNEFDPEAPAGKTIQQMQTEGLRDFMRHHPESINQPATSNSVSLTEKQDIVNRLQEIWRGIGNGPGRNALDDGWSESFRTLPETLSIGGDQYQAHGMGKSSFGSALKDLLNLFEKGIDPNRGGGQLYTAPLASEKGTNAGAGLGTASGNAYTDGAFVLVAKRGVQTIRNISDIGGILVNSGLTDINANIVTELKTLFPDLAVESYRDAKSLVEQLNNSAKIQPSANAITRFAHDPSETMNAVTEQAQAFPGVNIVAVDNEASLPPEIKAQIEQQTAAGRVRGLFNAPSETVYIMSDKVAPADVPLVLLHETVGHLGLRRAFGQQLDPLLDGIFRDYAKDIIAGNESGRWGFNLTDDLTGENDLSGQQRQAAEEFIANTAERIQSGEVRPMWWKGLIVRFKQALRNVPGFKNLRFTDREIEGVLFLSAKAAGRLTTETQRHGEQPEIRFDIDPSIKPDVFAEWGTKYTQFENKPLEAINFLLEKKDGYAEKAFYRDELGWIDIVYGKTGEGKEDIGGYGLAHILKRHPNIDFNQVVELFKNGIVIDGHSKNKLIISPDNKNKVVIMLTWEGELKQWVVSAFGRELENKKRSGSTIGFSPVDSSSVTAPVRGPAVEAASSKDSIQPDSGNVKFSLAPTVSGKVNTEWIDKKSQELKADLELTNSMVNSPLSKAGPVDNYYETAKIKLLDKIKSGTSLDVLEQQYLNDIKTDNELNIDAYGNIGLLKLVREARRNSVRFSLASMPGSDIEALGKILLPGVADGSIKSDIDAGEYLKKQGITSLETHEIQFAYGEARYQLKQIEARRLKFEYKNWLASQHPILSGIEERLGVNKIKVDKKFGKQKDFAGAYVDYKNGMPSDEAAKILGVDEADLVEAVRGVKKNDLKAQFKTWKAESSPDAYYAKLAEADRAREVEGMIDDVLAGQLKLSDELRAKYPEVADAVYQRITGNEGKAPADFDWLAAAAQLQAPPVPASEQSTQSTASDPGFMAGFAAGRQQAAQEYQDLIAAVKANQDDITASQKLLKEYAFKHLPKGERDLALKKITQLSEVSNEPTAKYPKGQRHALLEEIFNQINKQRENLMRSQLLERIQERLKQTAVKRGQTGKPVGKYGAEAQVQLDRIREISRLTPGMVYNEQSYWQDMAEQAQNEGGDPSHALAQIAMLETFGVLDGKNSDQLVTALAEIQRLAHDGRMELMKTIQSRRLDIENMRQNVVSEVSGDKGLMSPQQASVEEHRRAGNKVREGLYKYWRQNLNFTWIMNNVTRLSGKALKDTQAGKFVDAEHRAEQKEMTGRRSRANAFNEAFDKIFGTSGNVSRGREYVQLRQLEKQSGVFRFQRPSGGAKGLKFERMTPDAARELLNDHKEGKARLLDYEVECLKHQLDDIDAGEKYKSTQSQMIEDEIMQQIAKENQERMVTLPRIADPGKLVEQPLTQGEALHLWLCWQQPNVRYKMSFNGWTADSIKQLETFLRPEARKLGEWMRDELEKDFPAVNEVFRNQYYTDMPHSPNYFPTAYNVKGGIGDNTKDAFGMPYGMASVSPGALKSRRFHLLEPAANDAFATYAAHVVQMEHFKAVSGNINDMRGVFNNPDVRNVITQYRGEQAYTDLVNSVTILADGGRRDAAKISFISGMYAPWVASKLMINLQSATKQLAGVFAYVNSIPAAPFVKGCAEFWKAPADNARMLMNTDYFKNRWSGAMDRDLNMLLDWSSSVAGKNSGWMHELVQNGSILNKAGDALSVVCGGYAVYKYHYDNLIKRGVPADAAHDQAIIEWEKASDSTQQSGAIKDMNYFQMGGTIDRMMTTYMSNPILVMQAQTETLLDALAGRNTAENAAKFGRMVMINHIIVPALMTGIVQAIKHRDNWDEYELSDFIVSSLLGPFNALFLLGKGLDSIVPLLMGKYQQAASTFPVIDEISHAFSQGKKIAEGNADLTTDEVLKTIAITGAALTPFSNTAAVIGAAGREGRRWWNFFTGDGDKKQKKHTLTGITP